MYIHIYICISIYMYVYVHMYMPRNTLRPHTPGHHPPQLGESHRGWVEEHRRRRSALVRV